jgi:hypothetical protein
MGAPTKDPFSKEELRFSCLPDIFVLVGRLLCFFTQGLWEARS